ncbi:HNH endonuclease [Rhizobium laguerreae]|uniref:HNH endonuclease n=1 Tax=Rhizobium laguerreae TaxID=1076926 RepID=UPI0035E438F9
MIWRYRRTVTDGEPDVVQNGIALSATVQGLFDKHLIAERRLPDPRIAQRGAAGAADTVCEADGSNPFACGWQVVASSGVCCAAPREV